MGRVDLRRLAQGVAFGALVVQVARSLGWAVVATVAAVVACVLMATRGPDTGLVAIAVMGGTVGVVVGIFGGRELRDLVRAYDRQAGAADVPVADAPAADRPAREWRPQDR